MAHLLAQLSHGVARNCQFRTFVLKFQYVLEKRVKQLIMPELFVKKSVEINAPASKIWDVLTRPEFTRQWISNFGGIDGEIVSDWALGSPVLWKGADGTPLVEGNVTAVEPGKLLRFTVFDVRSERPPVSDE